MDELTRLVLEYQRTGTGYAEIVSGVLLRAYMYVNRRSGYSEDDCGDFALYFHPRIRAIVERFQFDGKPFQAYLMSTMKWQLKSYTVWRARRNRREQLLARKDLWNDAGLTSDGYAVFENYGEAGPTWVDGALGGAFLPGDLPAGLARTWRIDGSGTLVNDALRKRLLLLAMKGCLSLNDRQIAAIARITGRDETALINKCQELRAGMHKSLERRRSLEMRRNRAYFAVQSLEDELSRLDSGPRLDDVRRRLDQWRIRLARARRRLSHVTPCPTHRDIAHLMQMPKGSVDSSIYYIRNAYLRGADGEESRN